MGSGLSGHAASLSLIKVNGGGGYSTLFLRQSPSGLKIHHLGLSSSSILFTPPSFAEVFSLCRPHSSCGTDQPHYPPCIENIYCVLSLCCGREGDFVCGLQMSF